MYQKNVFSYQYPILIDVQKIYIQQKQQIKNRNILINNEMR